MKIQIKIENEEFQVITNDFEVYCISREDYVDCKLISKTMILSETSTIKFEEELKYLVDEYVFQLWKSWVIIAKNAQFNMYTN